MAKSSLDKKFDQIRKREEEKTFSTKKRSRIVNKFLKNNSTSWFMKVPFSPSESLCLSLIHI